MISNEELKKLSKLARIEISEEELGGLGKDINSILDYIGQITQINPSTTELYSGYGAGADKNLRNVMREDENPHEGGEFSDDLLNEAPNKENKYVKVKKIL
ncbi:MAG: Asp-tRNA(Asn)/Glu-tRNA(Gln) amidotransferase subunit GatC [Patescibacteria group bacterium]